MEQRKTPLLDAIVDHTTNRPVYLRSQIDRVGNQPRLATGQEDGIFPGLDLDRG